MPVRGELASPKRGNRICDDCGLLLDFLDQPVRCLCTIIQGPPRLVLGAGGGTVGARSIAISICRARRCGEARSIKKV